MCFWRCSGSTLRSSAAGDWSAGTPASEAGHRGNRGQAEVRCHQGTAPQVTGALRRNKLTEGCYKTASYYTSMFSERTVIVPTCTNHFGRTPRLQRASKDNNKYVADVHDKFHKKTELCSVWLFDSAVCENTISSYSYLQFSTSRS